MKVDIFNAFAFVIFLIIPLIAELLTATPNNVPGTGFSVLLYQPFDFAYVFLVCIIFLIGNIVLGKAYKTPFWISAGISFIVSAAWFIVSFLAVAQLHLSLGGKL